MDQLILQHTCLRRSKRRAKAAFFQLSNIFLKCVIGKGTQFCFEQSTWNCQLIIILFIYFFCNAVHDRHLNSMVQVCKEILA